MTLPFQSVPSDILNPLFYAEVSNAAANSATQQQRTLIIGQINSASLPNSIPAGTGTPNVPVISQGVADAATVGGPGSMLHLMTQWYRKRDTFGEVWYLPLADNGSGVAATGTIAYTAAATANGTHYLYIAGVRVSIPILTTQTTAQIATAVAAAVNAVANLPVTASASTSTVTFTAINKGPAGNDIDIRVNYQGTAGNEVTPAGLAFTITAMASGATPPDLTTGLANLLDKSFDFIVCPYTDSTTLNALKSFLNDQTGRWSATVQIYGHYFAAYRGTLSACTTFGTARNDQHGTVVGFNDSPTPSWLWAANMAGAAAVSLRNDPALPLQTLAMDVLAPPLQSRFILTDRNTLLHDGMSTFTVDDDGTVRIENMVTTYQKNAFGQPDNSYLEVETMFTLMAVLRRLKAVVTSKYARVKLADDGTPFAPGSAIVTPNIVRGDLIAAYRKMCDDGLCQAPDAFSKALIVQRNSSNPNRLDVLYPPVLINQLRIFALLAQFRLSSTQ